MSLRLLVLLAITFASTLWNAPSASAQDAASKIAQSENLFWIFLTTGKSAAGTDQEELEKMQGEHIGNFQRLGKEGKLLTAGPMSDPDKKLRGIVVAKADDTKALDEYFKTDPFVQHGFLTVDAYPLQIGLGKFNSDIDPESLEEHRLVILDKAESDVKDPTEEELHKNLEYCQKIFDKDRLRLAALIESKTNSRRAIMIFKNLEDKTLQPLIDELPAVKSNAWKATTMPLFLTKGTLD